MEVFYWFSDAVSIDRILSSRCTQFTTGVTIKIVLALDFKASLILAVDGGWYFL